jgi:bifunctional polynucleotide phosphatase/kinase
MRWTYLNSDLKSSDFASDESGFCYGSNRKNFRLPQRITMESSTENSSKIAAFDLDSTLIKTKTGRTFAINADDWQWFSPNVPSVLNRYYLKGYRVLIITNQARIKRSSPLLAVFQDKISQIDMDIRSEFPKIEFEVICLNHKNVFRKPHPTSIDEIFPNGVTTDSFYCGDAANRLGDHSDSDAAFASNALMRFCTPEYLFLSDRNNRSELDELPDLCHLDSQSDYRYSQYSDRPELIIMVGYPGSGKSHVTRKIVEDSIFNHESYEDFIESKRITVLSLDLLKTRPKLYAGMKEVIAKRQSMLVDNTSLSRDDRTKLIQILKDCSCRSEYVVRVIHIQRSMTQAYRLNCYRLYKNYETDMKFVPERVYKMMRARYVAPTVVAEDIDIVDLVNPGNPIDYAYNYYYG